MSTLGNILLIACYIAVSVAGLTLIKFGGWKVLPGFALYGTGFAMWYWILTRLPLSRAFPVAAGGLIIGTQLAGWLILGEHLELRHVTGVALVLAGIIVLFGYS